MSPVFHEAAPGHVHTYIHMRGSGK